MTPSKLSKIAQQHLIAKSELASWSAKLALEKLNPPAPPDPSSIAFAGAPYAPDEPSFVREARWLEAEAARLQEIQALGEAS